MTWRAYVFPGWGFDSASLEPVVSRIGGAAVVDRLEDANLLIGWSLGGLRALLAPAHMPTVLIASTARFLADPPTWPGMPAANLRAMQRLFAREPEQALRSFHTLCARFDTSPDEIESRVLNSLAIDADILKQGLLDLARLDLRPILPSYSRPTLLLHGAHDRVISAAAARATAACMPNAKLIIRSDAGHDLPLQDPEWVADRIREFVESASH